MQQMQQVKRFADCELRIEIKNRQSNFAIPTIHASSIRLSRPVAILAIDVQIR